MSKSEMVILSLQLSLIPVFIFLIYYLKGKWEVRRFLKLKQSLTNKIGDNIMNNELTLFQRVEKNVSESKPKQQLAEDMFVEVVSTMSDFVDIAYEIANAGLILDRGNEKVKAIRDNFIAQAENYLVEKAIGFSDVQRLELRGVLYNDPRNFIAEFKKIQTLVLNDSSKVLADLCNDVDVNLPQNSLPNTTQNQVIDAADNNAVNDDSVKSEKTVTNVSQIGAGKTDLTELNEEQIEINQIREMPETKEYVNFREVLPQFKNGIDEALANCKFTVEKSGRTGLKSTSKWDIDDLDNHDITKIILAFSKKLSDKTKPYNEVYNYLVKVRKLISIAETDINVSQQG